LTQVLYYKHQDKQYFDADIYNNNTTLKPSNTKTLISQRCKSGTWAGTQNPQHKSQPAQEPALPNAQATVF
jgi:thiamine phosphate synthase YjbQ (UPF0047 family)